MNDPNPISAIAGTLDEQSDKWRNADQRIRASLYVGASFATTIRTLVVDEEENLARKNDVFKLSDSSRFLVRRLLKAPSLLSPLFFLTLTYQEEKIIKRNHISPDHLIKLYQPVELAAFLALVYLYHRLRCVSNPEEWTRYSKTIIEVVELAGIIGRRVPDIGFANCLIAVGAKLMAGAVLLQSDPKTFKNYRRDVKIQGRLFSAAMEFELWGCSHCEIAARLMQLVGFGAPLAQKIYQALVAAPDRELDLTTNRLRLALVWSEALYLGIRPRVVKGEEQILSSESALDQLLDQSARIRTSGSQYSWLAKRKSAISRRFVPQLYDSQDASEETLDDSDASAETSIEDFMISYAELPEKMRERFSEGEFTDLSNEINDLIDQK